jgi:O-antigen ligase
MMPSSVSVAGQATALEKSAAACSIAGIIRPLQALIAAPTLLFLATLTLILFRPANVGLLPCDRVAFLLLAFIVTLRILLLRNGFPFVFSISVPMLGLLALALAGAWTQGFDPEAWSLVAAKFVVPFAMFHLAALVFTSDSAVRRLEMFCIAALAYLCFVSIAFLAGAPDLIFPRFILDGGVETHAERARGPFLQAVANGVTLNLLGLLAFELYRRRRIGLLIAMPLLLALPIAIFATMTRSVWLGFVLSVFAVVFTGGRGRFRRVSVCVALGAILTVCAAAASASLLTGFQDRFEDRDTVRFRLAVYQLSGEMIREKPLMGWGQGQFAREIEARISDYRPESYAAHNTYLEILVEHGAIGMALYVWMGISLWRLGTKSNWLHFTWPVLLGVYFLNACFVVMNYQFVNTLVFTFAGVLAYQNRCPSGVREGAQ